MKKTTSLLIAGLLSASLVQAADMANTAKAQYDADKKKADAQYVADKKLCAEESDSKARMQCLRDAKTEYTKALAAAKAAMSAPAKPAAAACPDCGKVTAVQVSEKEGEGSAVGMIAGGLAGAMLGHQVGQGTGKDLATIAGAAGGAYAGNKIEQKMKTAKVWSVRVKLDSGEERSFSFKQDPGLAAGDAVRVEGDTVKRR